MIIVRWDMTWPQKKTMTKINTNTETNTFREHIQIVIRETCDFWNIWSEWWGDMTWPTKRQLLKEWKIQSQIQIDRPWQKHDMVCELEWIVYILHSWEPEFRTLIVTWKLRVSMDSIHNSCDVWPIPIYFLKLLEDWIAMLSRMRVVTIYLEYLFDVYITGCLFWMVPQKVLNVSW